MSAAETRLATAQATYDRDKHGKDAFLGSSSWGAYQAARRELEAAKIAAEAERAAVST